ncbi:MAG TPA: AAA family ATPase [Actinomycetota bacterium]|nr:AAA family ATPase [Actinomycetota bacterium]
MEAVIFCGVQASGKSTFYADRFFDSHVRINLDMLRTRNRERLLLRACLDARQPFVVDNTNPTAAERRAYLDPALAAGFRAVCYFFEVSTREAIGRNQHRVRQVPVFGILGTYKRIEPPSLEEGFAQIFKVVPGTADERFVVEETARAGP